MLKAEDRRKKPRKNDLTQAKFVGKWKLKRGKNKPGEGKC